jgi:hypothetical protein
MRILTVRRKIPLDIESPCLFWEGDLSGQGYGRVMIDGQTKYAHRLAYQLQVGPIPRGWEVDHVCHGEAIKRGGCGPGQCRHRSCVNPAHLEAVSSRENSMRGGHPLFAIARSNKCGKGHDLTDPANVYTYPSGKRKCRQCTRESQKNWRASRANSHR